MKKHTFYTILLIFTCAFFQNAIAQNTSPYWSLAGNSNVTRTPSKLGTINNEDLRLITANIQRMVVSYNTGNVGIGTTSPSERLHINSLSGSNALRVQVGGSTKLLVASGGGVSVGANVTPPSNGLLVAGNVGLGTTSPTVKLDVVGVGRFMGRLLVYKEGIFSSSAEGNGVEAYASLQGGYGVYAVADYGFYGIGNTAGLYASGDTGVIGSGEKYGIVGRGYINGVLGSGVVGVSGKGTSQGVSGTGNSYGVRGTSTSGKGVSGNGPTGVEGASTDSYGYGMRGLATGSGGVGLYARSTNGIGVYGETNNASSYAGFFGGDLYSSGSYVGSDRSLKRDIADLASAMDILKRLQPKSYSFKQDGDYRLMNLPQGKHYGLIAQDVEQVLPELVKASVFNVSKATTDTAAAQTASTKELSFKALNYTELIPIVVKGMQEQEQHLKELDEKTAEIANLKSRIETLEALVRGVSGNTVSMTSLSAATPNPVKGSTRISYTIPTNSRAQLLLTDATGKTIKVVTLTNSGYTNLNTVGLSSGVYNYSLVVDGKAVETKKMTVIR